MAVQTKERVFTLLQDHKDRIRQFGVKHLGLFGSFVRQQQDAESDVDVLVEFEPERKTSKNGLSWCLSPGPFCSGA